MSSALEDNPLKLAVIAGSGDLVKNLLSSLKQEVFIDTFVIGFEGITPDEFLLQAQSKVFKLGEVQRVLDQLKTWGVTDIVFLGGMKRPNFSSLSLDFKGIRWLSRMGVKAFGDDGLLSSIALFLKEEGFTVRGAHEFLDSTIKTLGSLTLIKPSHQDLKDIQKGVDLLKLFSPLDIGQSVVIQTGVVLGVEAVEGTQKLIKRVGGYKHSLAYPTGGILVKMSKTCQDERLDRATIGVQTILDLKESGLNGIAIKAGDVNIINPLKVIKIADELDIFIESF
ncbi:MAG TPA: UDP-2,3-diacylglucosamine diphosphatase LpxI [Alphaproteobacteria bacterium]|nr:UDP-2,3-diacylglucosamine diphosphatase LpxI [Alphaproteobacteria bacterium]